MALKKKVMYLKSYMIIFPPFIIGLILFKKLLKQNNASTLLLFKRKVKKIKIEKMKVKKKK